MPIRLKYCEGRSRWLSSGQSALINRYGTHEQRKRAPAAPPTAGLRWDVIAKVGRYSYRWLKANTLLCGALGWGRLNRRHFIQIPWIPIPLWTTEPLQKDAASVEGGSQCER